MRTYIIIDRLGSRHATIKANTNLEAIEIYLGCKVSRDNSTIVSAIDKEDLEAYKKNIKRLK